jgi:hypothetical protein
VRLSARNNPPKGTRCVAGEGRTLPHSARSGRNDRKRDEPQGRQRGATNPQPVAQSNPLERCKTAGAERDRWCGSHWPRVGFGRPGVDALGDVDGGATPHGRIPREEDPWLTPGGRQELERVVEGEPRSGGPTARSEQPFARMVLRATGGAGEPGRPTGNGKGQAGRRKEPDFHPQHPPEETAAAKAARATARSSSTSL